MSNLSKKYTYLCYTLAKEVPVAKQRAVICVTDTSSMREVSIIPLMMTTDDCFTYKDPDGS